MQDEVTNTKGSMVYAQMNSQVNQLREHYETQFLQRFGSEPVTSDEDVSHIRVLLQKLGMDRAKRIIVSFLNLEDDWFREKGYTLEALRNNLNKVLVKSGGTKPKFFVGWTASGVPAWDHKPDIPKGMPRDANEFYERFRFEPDPIPEGWINAFLMKERLDESKSESEKLLTP